MMKLIAKLTGPHKGIMQKVSLVVVFICSCQKFKLKSNRKIICILRSLYNDSSLQKLLHFYLNLIYSFPWMMFKASKFNIQASGLSISKYSFLEIIVKKKEEYFLNKMLLLCIKTFHLVFKIFFLEFNMIVSFYI